MRDAGEKLTLLDGQNITLHPTDLVIADDARAHFIAGIMGGSATGITPIPIRCVC